jgi:hypothetical protein
MREFMIKDKNGKEFAVYKVADNPNSHDYYITINKLKEGSTTAKDENVETYANFIFELDHEPVENQKERAKKLVEDRVVNRVVDSAGKSIHCRITLEDEPSNKEEYTFIWNKLNEIYFEGKADTQCNNPARLTRTPLGIRTKWKNEKGEMEVRPPMKQERLFLNNNKLEYKWREEYEKEKLWENYLQNIHKIRNDGFTRKNVSTIQQLRERNIPVEAKKLINNDFADGEKHNMIPKAIAFLKYAGISKEEICSLVKDTKINDSKNYAEKLYDFVGRVHNE